MKITNKEVLIAQIKGLEAQLAVLESQVKRLGTTTTPKPFASLYGILKGKTESSEEDIESVKYHMWGD